MDKWLPDTCAPDKFAGTFCCWGVILQASAGVGGRVVIVIWVMS